MVHALMEEQPVSTPSPSQPPTDNAGMSVSVAICTYTDKRWSILVDAIQRVDEQVTAGDEIIIVVDHSPSLLDRVSARFPHVRVLENSYGNGLSGARNTAVDHATRDVVVFLDDDAVPRPGWLDAMRLSYADDHVMGVGGVVLPIWPSTAPSWMPDEFLWVVGCSYTGLPISAVPIRNPIGANMSFRREVFAGVGGFSESLGRVGTLPVGCEETELSMRAGVRFADRVIIQQPAAAVDHYVTAERTAFDYFVKRCWSEGLSKAAVTRLAEQSGTLSTERSYITATVIPAFGRELRRAVGGDRTAWGRAAALIVGTGVTGGSYVLHSALHRIKP
jgi:glycosyltransferase involved in cell wall biosynthesis